jgi:hypothetical protein
MFAVVVDRLVKILLYRDHCVAGGRACISAGTSLLLQMLIFCQASEGDIVFFHLYHLRMYETCDERH